jgi:hypothetical protein
MPATVPLTSPVKSVTSARALAESVAAAGPQAVVGPAVDRIVHYLRQLPYPALVREAEGVLDILHLLGSRRARVATEWLARWALDGDCAGHWFELNDLVALGSAA